jgi:hypothetical protein
VAEVIVGGQVMQLIVDTGSTTTAVASANCSSCGIVGGFRPTNATRTTLNEANGLYGDDSSWRGYVVEDTIAVSGLEQRMRFAVIEDHQGFFQPAGMMHDVPLCQGACHCPHRTWLS